MPKDELITEPVFDTLFFLGWSDVTGWVNQGGALLGTKRLLPGGRLDDVAKVLEEYKIQSLLIIGGFEVR